MVTLEIAQKRGCSGLLMPRAILSSPMNYVARMSFALGLLPYLIYGIMVVWQPG